MKDRSNKSANLIAVASITTALLLAACLYAFAGAPGSAAADRHANTFAPGNEAISLTVEETDANILQKVPQRTWLLAAVSEEEQAAEEAKIREEQKEEEAEGEEGEEVGLERSWQAPMLG